MQANIGTCSILLSDGFAGNTSCDSGYEVVLQGLFRVWSQTLQVLGGSKSSPCGERFYGFSSSDLLMKFSSDSLEIVAVNDT